MPPGSRPENEAGESGRIHPCPTCQIIGRGILEAACAFGSRVEANEGLAEFVCSDHLPLIVGYTAPRHLARWLEACFDAAPGLTAPCSLCAAAAAAAASFSEESPDEFSCASHGGSDGPARLAVRRELRKIAEGERLPESDERRVLRTALILFASVRGSSVFVSRLE